jgi:hypothetical protein
MTQLDPELRRLIQWSRTVGRESPDLAPPGFSTRLSARCRAERETAEPWWWARLQWASVCGSVLLVAAGIGFWAIERSAATLAYEVFPVYQIAARSLAP